MADRVAKTALFDGLVSAAKALASGRRAEIVDVLAQGERTVEDISTEIEQSIANTSQHLQQLLRAGLVRTRRDGTRIHYAVAAEHAADVERLATAYLGDRDQLQTVTRAELKRRLRSRDVIVLDVRPTAEYQAGHIAGAISVPIDDLPRKMRDLPPDADVVAYCRGPYCVYADQAVRTLTKRGRRAARLEDGYPEWAR